MMKPETYLNYKGQEWTALKMWLEEQKRNKVGLLIGAANHDDSNKLRGALQFIDQILALEKAAERSRQ